MRAPTMTELYAFGPFVAAIPQDVGTKVFGDPALAPEKMFQIDAGISTQRENWRADYRDSILGSRITLRSTCFRRSHMPM